jgi:spermine oxidase
MWTLLLFFIAIFSVINCEVRDDGPRIVIVGGGLAGVSALSRLLENGYRNVVLLEAQRRFGGRVKTIRFGANVVDMGAQWVHGETGNVIFEMANRHGMLDRTPYEWIGVGGKFLI